MKSKPADKIQDLQFFGEFGGVNPSVSDSSTYTFLSAKSMSETFEGNTDGCYLYSRNSSPSNLYLEEALVNGIIRLSIVSIRILLCMFWINPSVLLINV